MQVKNSNENYLILFLFTVLSMVGILHHVLWQDEVNSWLAAKEAHSLSALIVNCRNSGAPLLWNILIYLTVAISGSIITMQLLHILISVIAAYFFLVYSPFSLLQKILILFGYYFLFEYNLICRNYNLTWLLLALFCSFFCRKQKNYFLLTIFLSLLANTHLFSLVLSIPLFIIVVRDYLAETDFKRSHLTFCLILFSVAVLLSVISIIPQDNIPIVEYAKTNIFTASRVSRTFSFFVRGLFPLPVFNRLHFWNTNYFIEITKSLSKPLSLLAILLPCLIFYGKRRWLVFYYTSSFSIVLLLYFLNLYFGTRYMGYCFLIFIATLWLYKNETGKFSTTEPSTHIVTPSIVSKRIINIFIMSVLLCQFIGGIYAYVMDIKYPFSEGKAAAGYISSQITDTGAVFVVPTQAGLPISAYLGRNIYYPDRRYYGSFVQWTSNPKPSCKNVIEFVIDEAAENKSRAFALVLALEMDSVTEYKFLTEKYLHENNYHIKDTMKFTNGIVTGENYFVYIVDKKQ